MPPPPACRVARIEEHAATYRPYPSVDRARRQLARHSRHGVTPVTTVRPETAQFVQEVIVAFQPTAARAVAKAAAALGALPTAFVANRRLAGLR